MIPPIEAPHIRASPLEGRPPKPVLYLQAWGDHTIPNPSGTNLVRAAGATDSVRYYRHDIARSIYPFLREDPDFFIAYLDNNQETAVALSAQTRWLVSFFPEESRFPM